MTILADLSSKMRFELSNPKYVLLFNEKKKLTRAQNSIFFKILS